MKSLTEHRNSKRKNQELRRKAASIAITVITVWTICIPVQSFATDDAQQDNQSTEQTTPVEAVADTDAQTATETASQTAAETVDANATVTEASDASSSTTITNDETDTPAVVDTTADDATVNEDVSAAASETTTAATAEPETLAASVEQALAPQATGVHFTKLELRKGSIDGEVVCDLLQNTNPTLDAGQEYYLCVSVTKDNYLDNCWVSINLPWWTTPVNMIGGDNWMTPGSSVTATALDKVLAYTPNTGYSAVATSTAGKVTYHIKDTEEAKVQVATFEISFRPTVAYGNTSESAATPVGQTWSQTANKISFACGDMDGSSIGAAVDTITTGTTTVTSQGGFRTYGTKFPLAGLNNPVKSSRDFWISTSGMNSGKSANTIWKDLEFDITFPLDTSSIGDITYGGFTATKSAVTTNPDGSQTIHCTVATQGSPAGGIAATAGFSTATIAKKEAVISNVRATVWGDETAYEIPGETTLEWYVYDGPGTIELHDTDVTRFDWNGYENVTNDMLVGFMSMTCLNGDPAQFTATQTVSVDYASNLAVRAITVPLYDLHATTITLNGTSYNLADVATKVVEPAAEENGNGYAVISATKAGLANITSCVFEIGKLPGGANTAVGYQYRNPPASDYADAFEDLHWSSWGSITNANPESNTPAVSTYRIYPTDNPTAGDTATATVTPTKTKTMTYYCDPSGGTLTKTAMMCGDTTHFTANFIPGQWPQTQGQTSAYDDTEAYYLTLPLGFKFKNFTLDGVSVDPVDVTSTCTNVPTGMKIYKVTYPAGQDRQAGIYTTSLTGPYRQVQFDLTTSPYLNAGTYSMKDLFQVATDPDALVDTQYTGIWGNTTLPDTYGVNDGKTVTAPTAEFTIQPFNGVSVTNSMYLLKNGIPLNEWFTYNETDPENTIGQISKDFSAVYRVTIKNETDRTASNVKAFIAVPKVGQDFGDAYTPEGAQQFDLTFTARDVPEGWTVHYLKMNAGVSYDTGQYPHPGDYTEVTDPSQADMIMIEGANDVGAGVSTNVTFTVTSPTDLNTVLGAKDLWGCNTRYEADGSEIVPLTMFPEGLEVGYNPLSANDVSVEKSVDKEKLGVGETANYTIKVTNNSNVNITNYYLVDTMPSLLDYVSCSDNGTYDSAARTITWNFDLAANESKTVTVAATTNATGTATNVATVYGHDPDDPTKPDFQDPIDDDDATVAVVDANVTVTKSADVTSVKAGDKIVYTITAENKSDVAATGFYVYDAVPTNTTLDSYDKGDADSAQQGTATDGSAYVSWYFKTIPANKTKTMTMTVTVNSGVTVGTSIANTALYEVTGKITPPDPGTKPGGKTNQVDVSVATTTVAASKLPKTGDGMGILIPFALAALGMGAVAVSRKRRRD